MSKDAESNLDQELDEILEQHKLQFWDWMHEHVELHPTELINPKDFRGNETKEAIKQAISVHVIGKDDHSMTQTLENPSWNDMRRQASLLGQNELRKQQRSALYNLEGEEKKHE